MQKIITETIYLNTQKIKIQYMFGLIGSDPMSQTKISLKIDTFLV